MRRLSQMEVTNHPHSVMNHACEVMDDVKALPPHEVCFQSTEAAPPSNRKAALLINQMYVFRYALARARCCCCMRMGGRGTLGGGVNTCMG